MAPKEQVGAWPRLMCGLSEAAVLTSRRHAATDHEVLLPY